MTDEEKDKLLADFEPMFAEAKENRLWLYCTYQDLWFSPSELRQAHKEGRFIWGVTNFKLRNPYELMNEYDVRIRNNEESKKLLYQRIESEGFA